MPKCRSVANTTILYADRTTLKERGRSDRYRYLKVPKFFRWKLVKQAFNRETLEDAGLFSNHLNLNVFIPGKTDAYSFIHTQ